MERIQERGAAASIASVGSRRSLQNDPGLVWLSDRVAQVGGHISGCAGSSRDACCAAISDKPFLDMSFWAAVLKYVFNPLRNLWGVTAGGAAM